ncbi:MAG: cupredoxin domain-containing protein, partial [Lysobacterales bacterium]
MISVALAASISPAVARAAPPEFTLVIKEHRFEPERLEVPANTRVKLIVDNQDSTPEEFE